MRLPTLFRRNTARQRGTSLIEVLVTMVILAIGMLGVAGLQSRLQMSEMEAYQRAQAMILLGDMSNRIMANRNAAASYVTGTSAPVGGSECATSTTSLKDRDLRDWCLGLRGAGETSAAGNSVGTLLGGRGCVTTAGTNQYLVTVAWQGLGAVSAPNANLACGRNLYNGSGSDSACSGDRCRRVVTTLIRVAPLQ